MRVFAVRVLCDLCGLFVCCFDFSCVVLRVWSCVCVPRVCWLLLWLFVVVLCVVCGSFVVCCVLLVVRCVLFGCCLFCWLLFVVWCSCVVGC